MDRRWGQLADILVNYSTGVQPGERVMIAMTELASYPLTYAVYKAAVKAGDRLNGDEVSALLQQRHLCQDPHHCSHGRPTALMFTPEELDKRFQRI